MGINRWTPVGGASWTSSQSAWLTKEFRERHPNDWCGEVEVTSGLVEVKTKLPHEYRGNLIVTLSTKVGKGIYNGDPNTTVDVAVLPFLTRVKPSELGQPPIIILEVGVLVTAVLSDWTDSQPSAGNVSWWTWAKFVDPLGGNYRVDTPPKLNWLIDIMN